MAVTSRTLDLIFRNKYKGGNAMICDLLIAFVTCVATVISTIIAVLRYKKDNE